MAIFTLFKIGNVIEKKHSPDNSSLSIIHGDLMSNSHTDIHSKNMYY